VHGPKHVVKRGKTTVLTAEQARELLDSIPLTRKIKLSDGTTQEMPCLVGLRDRALISVITFAFARIGAVVAMRVEDYYPEGACMKKAGSATRCRRITTWNPISMPT
jgi:integrase/recombinase XerD